MKQHVLVLIAVLVATSIASMLIAVEWHRKNNEYKYVLGGYANEAALAICIEEVKEVKSKYDFSDITAKVNCEKKWGVKNDVPSFQTLIVKNIDEILITISIIALGIYILMVTYLIYAKCNSLGWKRLVTVVALIPCFFAAYFVYRKIGSTMILVLFGAIAGYVVSILVILGGRKLVAWVKEGFKLSH